MAALEGKLIGSLSGCVALVTGASRGIGKGIAQMICEAGATVYITGIIFSCSVFFHLMNYGWERPWLPI